MIDFLSLLIGAVVVVVVGVILRILLGGKEGKIDYDKIAHEIAERLEDSKILTDKRDIHVIVDSLNGISTTINTLRTQKGKEIPEDFKQIEKKIDYIFTYLGIEKNIGELDFFTLAYEDFLKIAEKELQEISKLSEKECAPRQRMLEFALNMALVYAMTQGDPTSIPKIKTLLKGVEKLY